MKVRLNPRVHAARKNANLTQAALAKKLGMRPNDLLLIERYSWTPNEEVRRLLAAALKTTPEDLFPAAQA